MTTTSRKNPRRPCISKATLEEMTDQATIDAYGASEQTTGWFTVIHQSIEVPFETKVLGMQVTVERVELDASEQIVAICRRGRGRQALPVLDLPLPSPLRPVRSGSRRTVSGVEDNDRHGERKTFAARAGLGRCMTTMARLLLDAQEPASMLRRGLPRLSSAAPPFVDGPRIAE